MILQQIYLDNIFKFEIIEFNQLVQARCLTLF